MLTDTKEGTRFDRFLTLFVQSSNTPVKKTVGKVELAKEVMELQKQIEEKDAEIEELRKK